MGLFNTIKINEGCPDCGGPLEGQTKNLVIDDKYPVENVLETFDLNERMDAEIITRCDYCDKRFDLVIRKGKIFPLESNIDNGLA